MNLRTLFLRARRLSILLVAGIAGASLADGKSVAFDEFRLNEYGDVFAPLPGKFGGAGWTGPWSGSAAIQFAPNQNYVYLDAVGYLNTSPGTEGVGGGSMYKNTSGGDSIHRGFASGPITEGYVWVSFLSNRISVNSDSDRTGVVFVADGNNYYVGTRRDEFGIGQGIGFLNLASVPGNTDSTTHLILARLDIANDTFSAWFNPSNVTSLAALGSPDVTDNSRVITSVSQSVQVRMDENSNVRINLDNLRIFHGADEEAGLRAVTALDSLGRVTLRRSNDADPVDITPEMLTETGGIRVPMGEENGSFRLRFETGVE